MKRQHGLTRLGLATALVVATACYDRTPLGLSAPAPEARVIARLTDLGAQQMAGRIGPAATEIEGYIDSATDSVWRIRLVRVDQLGGYSTRWSQELVEFPRSALNAPTERRLNKRKSWLMAGAVAAAVTIARFALKGFAGEEPRGCQADCPAQ